MHTTSAGWWYCFCPCRKRIFSMWCFSDSMRSSSALSTGIYLLLLFICNCALVLILLLFLFCCLAVQLLVTSVTCPSVMLTPRQPWAWPRTTWSHSSRLRPRPGRASMSPSTILCAKFETMWVLHVCWQIRLGYVPLIWPMELSVLGSLPLGWGVVPSLPAADVALYMNVCLIEHWQKTASQSFVV